MQWVLFCFFDNVFFFAKFAIGFVFFLLRKGYVFVLFLQAFFFSSFFFCKSFFCKWSFFLHAFLLQRFFCKFFMIFLSGFVFLSKGFSGLDTAQIAKVYIAFI